MRLQTKITLVVLPLVAGAILLTGVWAWYQAETAVRHSVGAHLDTLLAHYIKEHLAAPQQALVRNDLQDAPSPLADCQRRALQAAGSALGGHDGRVLVLDNKGQLIFDGGYHNCREVCELLGRVAVDMAGRSGQGTRAGIIETSQGQELYAAQYFRPWRWAVFLSVPESSLHANLENLRLGVFGLAGLCVLLAMLVIPLVLRRMIVKPVARLEAEAARIARREPAQSIGVNSRDELGSLARSMEDMAGAISDYEAQRDAWQKNLEERVRLRTDELRRSNLTLRAEVEQRKKAGRELRRERDRARTYFETAQVMFVVLDSRGRVESINRKGCQRLGYQPQEIAGQDWFELCIPPAERRQVRSVFQQLVEGRMELAEYFENQVVTKSGSLLTVSWHNAVMKGPGGEISGTIGAGLDVTEARQHEAAHRQAQKMEAIGTLAGGIAHDFNNILGAIYGYTEIASEELESGGRPSHELRQILAGCNRARDLVHQILTFSRQGDKEMHPVRVSSIVKEALKLMRASLPSTIEIRQNIVSEGDTVLAEPSQVHQVMMNLCTNAAHAMQSNGGTLTVEMRKESVAEDGHRPNPDLEPGDYVVISVSDTGHGMPPQVMERIFEPFFTTKERGEGTGMGLATTHGIVKGHGGAVSVSSAPGRGARFDVFLPVVAVETSTAHDDQRPIPVGSERVMFVDDEKPLVEIAERMLFRLGYQVTTFDLGVHALEALHRRPGDFDLLVTDLTMPHLTGLELARAAREIRPDLPVIICTGFGAPDLAERAKELGVRELVYKPLVTRDLGEAIRRALDGGRPQAGQG